MEIKIILTDYEKKIMEDSIPSIEEWFLMGPYKQKIKNHEKRIKILMREKFIKENKPLPPNENELIDIYFSDPNYKNRKQRDEEMRIENLKRFK